MFFVLLLLDCCVVFVLCFWCWVCLVEKSKKKKKRKKVWGVSLFDVVLMWCVGGGVLCCLRVFCRWIMFVLGVLVFSRGDWLGIGCGLGGCVLEQKNKKKKKKKKGTGRGVF